MYLYRRGIYLTLEIFAFLLLIHSMYIQPINFSKGVLLVRESQVLAVQALRPAAQTLSPADPQYCQESAKCQVYASFIPIILLTFSQVHPIINMYSNRMVHIFRTNLSHTYMYVYVYLAK